MEDIPIFKKMEYVEDSFVLFDKIDGTPLAFSSIIIKDVYYNLYLANN